MLQLVRNSYYQNPIPEPTDQNAILESIERIGRLCYRSDDLIKDDSAAGFIGRLKKRGHWAMLEHYIFTIAIPELHYENIVDPIWFDSEDLEYAQKLKFINITYWDNPPKEFKDYRCLISGSATAFSYLWACECVKSGKNSSMEEICEFMRYHHPHLMTDPLHRVIGDHEKPGDRFDDRIRFLSRAEVKSLPVNLRRVHDWMSVHLVVERSSTHDLVRHRPLVSYAQESTRWCNYDKKGLCFVIPCQFDESDKRILEDPKKLAYIVDKMDDPRFLAKVHDDIDLSLVALFWLYQLVTASGAYSQLINTYDQSPQEAKSVLPHSLRAEINITTFMGEWRHIFKMRADKAAYPQIQEVMVPLLNDSINAENGMFDDLKYLVMEGAQWLH